MAESIVTLWMPCSDTFIGGGRWEDHGALATPASRPLSVVCNARAAYQTNTTKTRVADGLIGERQDLLDLWNWIKGLKNGSFMETASDTFDQSKASIHVPWSISTNQRPAFRVVTFDGKNFKSWTGGYNRQKMVEIYLNHKPAFVGKNLNSLFHGFWRFYPF